MKGKIIKKISLWLPPILWAYMIFRFSSGKIPVASAVYWQDFAVKKTGHVLLFGFMAILVYRALRGEGVERIKAAVWAVAISALYGVSDEYHQMFTQGREARLRDVLIDATGAAVATFITYQLLPKLPKQLKIVAERVGLV